MGCVSSPMLSDRTIAPSKAVTVQEHVDAARMLDDVRIRPWRAAGLHAHVAHHIDEIRAFLSCFVHRALNGGIDGSAGIVRRIDDLGRVVIPKEIRRTIRIRVGDPLLTTLAPWEIFSRAMPELAKRGG